MPDAGSWPDWVAALVAALALIVAALAARAAVQTNSAQQEQLGDIQRLERERQANSLAVWVEAGPNEIARYRISNTSGQPIYNFTAWWIDDTKRCRPRMTPIIPPGEWWIFESNPMLPAVEPFGPTEGTQWPAEYTFTDHKQIEWKRSFNGSLVLERRPNDPLDLIATIHKFEADEAWWEKDRRR